VESLPASLALGALVLTVVAILLTRIGRRRPDPGDFERRLEELRKGHGLPGSGGAAIGHAPRPSPSLEDSDHEDALVPVFPPPPTLEEYAAPPGPVRVYTDPDLGEFTFDSEGEEWRQANEGGSVPWLYIEAGEDGPTEAQRRCLARFVDDEDEIVDRALDGVCEVLDSRDAACPAIEAASVYVEAMPPGQPLACGRIYFRFEGHEGLPASAFTTDDWVTLGFDVDSSPQRTR
jgi:hypothetical protein